MGEGRRDGYGGELKAPASAPPQEIVRACSQGSCESVEGRDRRHFCNKAAHSTAPSHLPESATGAGDPHGVDFLEDAEVLLHVKRLQENRENIHRYTWLSSQHILYQDVGGSTVGWRPIFLQEVCAWGRNGQLRLPLILF